MVLFLGFAAAMIGILLVAFNSGQVSNAKMRAMNAADAAAYSGAVWQARSLNYQAYINRAIIVNEVTIAQSVSLRSWIQFMTTFVVNVTRITRWIPPAAAASVSVQRVVDRANDMLQRTWPNLVESSLRAISHVENGTQVIMNEGATLAAQDLSRVVAERNGATAMIPSNAALLVLNRNQYMNLTQDYTNRSGTRREDGRARLKEVALASRDGFTYSRHWDLTLRPIIQVRKQGGTDLIDYDAWKGLDSAEQRMGWNYLKGEWATRFSLGWGGAQSYNPRIASRVGTHGEVNEWGDDDGRRANRLANRFPNAARNTGGLFPNYRDIVDTRRQNSTLSVAYAVEVMVRGSDIDTANSVNNAKAQIPNGEAIEHDPKYHRDGTGVYALSEACVRFERPYQEDRADRRTEYPSLFNPYWRASLATQSRAARAAADLGKALPSGAALLENGTCETVVPRGRA